MIASQDRRPKHDLYYLGALVIEVLTKKQLEQNQDRFDFMSVFQEVKNKEDISINLFMQSLCWLHLIDVIDYDNNEIIKCF